MPGDSLNDPVLRSIYPTHHPKVSVSTESLIYVVLSFQQDDVMLGGGVMMKDG